MTHHLLALTAGRVGDDLARSLQETFYMFYDTAWALVLGFGLSGAVQVFVSRSAMERQLGNHRPAALLRATTYGMASSSCSYAATAIAKSLFQKGADFISSMVFMFASTNLVVELGIVLAILLGWQFVAAEFIGGVIMIALVAVVGAIAFHARMLADVRRRVNINAITTTDDDLDQHSPPTALSRWSAAASYAISDLKMLRREMIIGYVIAGLLATLVPTHLWNLLFIHGHGFATNCENAVIGPLIAILSCVCSIGNVPLAAALWKGGISFSGVVSFIFADLIAFPLLLIYRRYYGLTMALRMLLVFWAVMAIAGVMTEEIFQGSGILPGTRPLHIVSERLSFASSLLDVVFFVIFILLYVVFRRTAHHRGVAGYAIDPICNMQVNVAAAPASVLQDGHRIYFCSDRCRERFINDR